MIFEGTENLIDTNFNFLRTKLLSLVFVPYIFVYLSEMSYSTLAARVRFNERTIPWGQVWILEYLLSFKQSNMNNLLEYAFLYSNIYVILS